MDGKQWVRKMNLEYPIRPLLTATQADAEIARLHGIIKSLQGTVFELQEAFAKLARKEK